MDDRIAFSRTGDEPGDVVEDWPEGSADGERGAQQDPVMAELAASRQKLGLTPAQLAERSGVPESKLIGWERGDGIPPLDALRRWAASLGLSLELVQAADQAGAGYRIDWNCRRLHVQGRPVRLTRMEWNILERLACSPGQLVTHRELYRHLYGEEREDRAQVTAIRVRISKLRQKVPFRIEARWGQGYVVEGIEAPPIRSADRQDEGGGGEPQTPAIEPAPAPRPRKTEYKAAPLPLGGLRPEPVRAAMPAQALRMAEPVKRMTPPPLPTSSAVRAAELGVIERFLAERGATRCPDPRMLAQSAAPGLVWDKIKRKWVRPIVDACALGLTQ